MKPLLNSINNLFFLVELLLGKKLNSLEKLRFVDSKIKT